MRVLPLGLSVLLFSSSTQSLCSTQSNWIGGLAKQLLQACELRVFSDSSSTKTSTDPDEWKAQAGILFVPIEAKREQKIRYVTQTIREKISDILDLQKVIHDKNSQLKAIDSEISTQYEYEIHDRQCHSLQCDGSQHLNMYYGCCLEKAKSTRIT